MYVVVQLQKNNINSPSFSLTQFISYLFDLVLRHSVPQYPSDFRDIARRVAEVYVALCHLPEQGNDFFFSFSECESTPQPSRLSPHAGPMFHDGLYSIHLMSLTYSIYPYLDKQSSLQMTKLHLSTPPQQDYILRTIRPKSKISGSSGTLARSRSPVPFPCAAYLEQLLTSSRKLFSLCQYRLTVCQSGVNSRRNCQ